MKKVLAILLAAVLVISLSGCGIPFTAKKIIDDSKIYSERDIEKAMNLVYSQFAFFEGCVLLELEYDEEYSNVDYDITDVLSEVCNNEDQLCDLILDYCYKYNKNIPISFRTFK